MFIERTFADGEQFEFSPDGRLFKAYSPTARPGSLKRMADGNFRFDLKGGDLCRSIDGNRPDGPNRAMIAGFGPTSRAKPGGTIRMRWGTLIEPPAGGILKSWHLNIGQVQATTDAGEYHTPPMSIEVKSISRTGPHKVDVEMSTLAGRNTAGQRAEPAVIGSAPIELGKVHWFEVEFVDGLGGPGRIRVVMNGAIIADHSGPTGYDNLAGVYPGWGLYRNPVDQELVGYLLQPDYDTA